MTGHDQADRQEQHLHQLFRDGIVGVGEDALERRPSFLDSSNDPRQSRLGQHHAGRGSNCVAQIAFSKERTPNVEVITY